MINLVIMNTKVSVIIPTYNRIEYILHTIQSIKNQTHQNIEIIVVNDGSSQIDYYKHDWKDVKIIHLDKNSKTLFGYANPGHVRNQGIHVAEGKYIAFCDDDDIWFPKKLELQLKAMKETGCKMSSTDGLIGCGIFDKSKHYELFNAEHYFEHFKRMYENKGLLDFPNIWNLSFLKTSNFMITSSVVIEKEILNKINNFNNIKPPGEDYDCWLKVLEHIDSVYITDSCFYYDMNHGEGRLWIDDIKPSPRVNFITFGAGGENFIKAGERLLKQAEAVGVFDKCILYTEEHLKKDNEFWLQHSTFIEQNKRGYGYWLWKPYLIKKMMEQMNDGDKLVYLDAGCEIDIKKKNELLAHMKYVEEELVIGSRTCIEREFTKLDLILKLDMLDAKYLENHQHQGGAEIYLVCDKTRDLINKWYELCCDYHLIDDTPSINGNLFGFQEHRHDQSVFSLLTKKYNLFSNDYDITNAGISISRNCSGISQL